MKLTLQNSLTKTAFICRNSYCMEKQFLSIRTCVPLHFSSCLSLCPHATWFLSNLYFAPLHTDSLWCMLNATLDSKLILSALFCPFVLKPATPAIQVCCCCCWVSYIGSKLQWFAGWKTRSSDNCCYDTTCHTYLYCIFLHACAFLIPSNHILSILLSNPLFRYFTEYGCINSQLKKQTYLGLPWI